MLPKFISTENKNSGRLSPFLIFLVVFLALLAGGCAILSRGMGLCLIGNVTRFKPIKNVEILAQQDGPVASSTRMRIEGVVPLKDRLFVFIRPAEEYYNEEMGMDVIRHRNFGYLEYNYTTEEAVFGQIYSIDPIDENLAVLQCSSTSDICAIAHYNTFAPWKMIELQTYDVSQKRFIDREVFRDDEGFLRDRLRKALEENEKTTTGVIYRFLQDLETVYLRTTNAAYSDAKIHKVNLVSGMISETTPNEFNSLVEYSTGSLYSNLAERFVPFLYDDRYTKRTSWPKGVTVLTEVVRSCFTGSSTDYVYKYTLLLQDEPTASLECYMCSLLYIDQHKNNVYYLTSLTGKTYLLRSNTAN